MEIGPDISVVIPHYDDLARLAVCLAAVEAQTIARDRFEIIVADNASPVSPEVLTAAIGTRARLVIAAERGAGPARNAGVAAARGAIIAFTDCDCVPAPGWLVAGIAELGGGDVVGGRMIVSVASEMAMSGAEAFERVFAFNNRLYVENRGFSVTANLLTRRAVFHHVGPFQNGVSEDVDWCQRARALGYRLVYADKAVVAHPARSNWAELRRKWERMNVETFGLKARGTGGKLRWLVRNLALPLSIGVHAPRVLMSRDLPDSGARTRALATLVRLRLWRMGHGIGLVFSGGRN